MNIQNKENNNISQSNLNRKLKFFDILNQIHQLKQIITLMDERLQQMEKDINSQLITISKKYRKFQQNIDYLIGSQLI